MPIPRPAALLAATLLLAAACNGGDEGDRPLQAMVIADPAHPDAAAGAQAAAQALNARGGIDGRKLDVLPCDTRDRADEAADCAREAVRLGMVATVGSFTGHGGAVAPVLERAGLPQVGVFPVSGPDFDSPVSFPVVGGTPTALVGMATVLADRGATRIAVVHPAGQAGQATATLARIGLRNRGLVPVATVAVTPDATDLGPLLAQLTGAAADGVVVALPADLTERVVRAGRDAGLTVLLAADPAALGPDRLAALGPAAEGVLVPSPVRPLSARPPGGRRFLEELEAFDPDAVPTDAALNGWMAVQLLAKAARRLDRVDRHTVFRAMDRLSDVDLGGLVPPYATTEVFALAGFSRLYNRTVVYAEVRGGVVRELDGRFVDPWVRP